MAGAPAQSSAPAAQQAPPVVASDQTQAARNVQNAGAGFAPAPAAPSGAAPQPAPGTIVAMRAKSTLKEATPASQPAAAGRLTGGPVANGLLTPPNPLHLTIEHNQGPDNGLSAIHGTVSDTSGAFISRASITLRAASGATAATTITDNNGGFTLSSVSPGQYELQISAPGFRTETEHLDLQARDLAQLSPALQVGAASQAVEVAAENTALATTSEPTDAQLDAIVPKLPGNLPATAKVVMNGRILALDTAGALYLSRDAGRHWKKIHAVWTGSIAHLALAEQAESPAFKRKEIPGNAAPIFEMTTTDGAVWISNDGAHWRLR